jgi:hypothetical protein
MSEQNENRIFTEIEILFLHKVGYPVIPKSYLSNGSTTRRDKWLNNNIVSKCGISRFEAMMYITSIYDTPTHELEEVARSEKKKFININDLKKLKVEEVEEVEGPPKPDFLFGMDSESESDCEMLEEPPKPKTATNAKFESTQKPKDYKRIDNKNKHQFMKLEETFDADKLNHIIINYEEFKKQLRWRARYDEIDPFLITKRYLERSRHGVVGVDYKQKRGLGRFCAVKSMSLQTIPREIRHTISRDFYNDIDMANAHPVILEYLCIKYGFNCDSLTEYIQNREELLKQVIINKEVASRDKSKQIYLSLTNGGISDYLLVSEPSDHIRNYKDEMLRLHSHFAAKFPEEFAKTKAKRISANKDYNHEAGFMNTLLCDMENEILMSMYEFFGSSKNAVLCFDGLMLPKGKVYDVKGCVEMLFDKFGIDMQIKIKTMDEHLDLENCIIKKYEYPRLEFFADFRTLVKKKTVYEEWVSEWINNAFQIIENNGKVYYLTKNNKVEVYADKTTEIRDIWKPTKPDDIEKSLRVKCNVINMLQDFEFTKKYKAMTAKEKKELDYSRSEITALTQPFLYTTLGASNARLGEGYLSFITENRAIESYNETDFFPYLKAKGEPPLVDAFNLFTGFPLENVSIENTNDEFINSKFYKHLKTDFFSDNEGELKHFLDHVADIIQDPAQIKTTSHLFYSQQGCGKGLLYKFMCKMLGIANSISIINTDVYFDSNFNSDASNKLLKVFEEVSEKGSAFKNHNRLKGEQASENERIEPKGIDSFYNRHCARFWYFTNNENALYIENDDRRHTLHRVKNTHANNYEYFKPMWEEIKNITFLKSAFDFFADREYEEKNVMNAFTTDYKKEQKTANLSNGIKFFIRMIEDDYKLEDVEHRIQSSDIKDKYKVYCEDQGIKYQFKALNTQIKKIGIKEPIKLSVVIDGDANLSQRKYCYIINTRKIQNDMSDFLKDPEYKLNFS